MRKEIRNDLLKLLWETELDIIPICDNDIFNKGTKWSCGKIYKVEVGNFWEYGSKDISDGKRVIYLHIGI